MCAVKSQLRSSSLGCFFSLPRGVRIKIRPAADWGKVNKALLDRNNASASVVTLVEEGARTRCDFAHVLLPFARCYSFLLP